MSDMLAAAEAPIIAGLNLLTLEAQQAAVDLARRIGAIVAPWPNHDHPVNARRRVSQNATLGQACQSDFVLKPAADVHGSDHPISTEVARRRLHTLFVGPQLDNLLKLRSRIAAERNSNDGAGDGSAVIRSFARHDINRVAVLLPSYTDPATTSQWHLLAADLQTELRMSVTVLPEPKTHANHRGILETLLADAGLTCATGSINFATESPTPCASAATILTRHATDLIFAAGLSADTLNFPDNIPRITLGQAGDVTPDPAAVWSIQTPGLTLGLRARVMRYDALIHWLADDDELQKAPLDPAVAVFERICESQANVV